MKDKNKFYKVILNKYSIENEVLYYKNRLWVLEGLYIDIIREVYD